MRTMLTNRFLKSRVWAGTAVIAALAVGLLLGSFAPWAEVAAQDGPSTTFSGETAIFYNLVSPSKTADFERVMRVYGEALAGSDNAQYNAMANGFKLYRVVEPGPNNYVIYYWFLDPVVSGGNYAVAKVLSDEMPDEVQALYEAYSGALEGGGQQAINMSLVMDF